MKTRYRYITVVIPFSHGEPKSVRAVLINARWCAYRADVLTGWSLTHRATGFAAGKGLRSVAAVKALARELERTYPVKAWTFTDPNAVKGMVKAKAVILKHEAFL